MIIVAGTLHVQPDQREQALALFQTMAEQSRAEAGCLAYDFFADLQDTSRFFVFERWADEAALRAHGWSPHMAEFRRQRAAVLTDAVDIRRYAVAEQRDA